MISEKIDKCLKSRLPSILAWKLRGSRVVSSFLVRVMTGAGYKELENRETCGNTSLLRTGNIWR